MHTYILIYIHTYIQTTKNYVCICILIAWNDLLPKHLDVWYALGFRYCTFVDIAPLYGMSKTREVTILN